MIHVYTGEDTMSARKAMRKAVEFARRENANALEARFDDMSFDAASACDALFSGGIFGGANIIIFDGILDNPEGEEFYRTYIADCANSTHQIFAREDKFAKPLLEKIKKEASLSDFPVIQKKVPARDNFKIADAAGMRDKRGVWVEFEHARRSGIAMEELHGILFWAFKSMYIAATNKKDEAIRSGMKDFTYRKYANFAKKFTVKEMEQKLSELKDIYHKAHRGEGDMDVLLELFLLRL